jgi:radical SAM protein with 4Fe4S-binding SPASM domain
MRLKKLKVELTKRCTLACSHCSAFANPQNDVALLFPRVEQLLYEFAELSGEEMTFTGGEPFIYNGISKLLQSASNLNIRTVIFSSGIVKNDMNYKSLDSEFFADYAALPNQIVFSLYSASADLHELVTKKPNSFNLTINSIKNCVALGIAVDLHFVPTKQNIDKFPDLVYLAETLGCKKIRILRYVPHGRGKLNKDILQPDFNDMNELISIVRRLKGKTSVMLKLGSAFGFLAPDLTTECAAGVDELVVDAKGNVFPCSALTNVRIEGQHGNILESKLQDVWINSEYLKEIRDVLEERKQCHTEVGCHPGCIAQKTIALGYISDHIMDPDQVRGVNL